MATHSRDIHLSATPNLRLSGVTYAQGAPDQPAEYPLSNAGKAVLRDGRLKMPFSIFVNHASSTETTWRGLSAKSKRIYGEYQPYSRI